MYRQCQRGYWRASKRWCKGLPPEAVDQALLRFAHNEAGLRPADVYGGPSGACAQLQQLAAWFKVCEHKVGHCYKVHSSIARQLQT